MYWNTRRAVLAAVDTALRFSLTTPQRSNVATLHVSRRPMTSFSTSPCCLHRGGLGCCKITAICRHLFGSRPTDEGGIDTEENTSVASTKTTPIEEGAEGGAEKPTDYRLDVSTKARGFEGKYELAEKLAIAQEEQVERLSHTAMGGGCSECGCAGEPGEILRGRDPSAMTPASSERFSSSRLPPPEELPRPILPAPLPRPLSHQAAKEAMEEVLKAAGIPPESAAATSPSLANNRMTGNAIERLLVESTLHSIRNSAAHLATPKGASHRGIQRLLDYNKQWAVEVSRCNPTYFADLAMEQKPEYLWIGCSDSRVPANEIVGLHPGDVFVHRNIGNIFSLSDLNCLSALQFAVDCLKVEHVIVAGHYKCGGVTAAMQGLKLGLTEHWIMQVTDIKNRWWHRVLAEIPERHHLNVLCELNVIEQLYHVVSCRVIQRRWNELNTLEHSSLTSGAGGGFEDREHIRVRDSYRKQHALYAKKHPDATARVYSTTEKPVDVEVHGWVYSLDDGILRPLLRLTRECHIEKVVNAAREAIFVRYTLAPDGKTKPKE